MATKIFKIRIKKGDTVMVRAGKFKGKTGKVLAVHQYRKAPPQTNPASSPGRYFRNYKTDVGQ
jgi:hypothetical protein